MKHILVLMTLGCLFSSQIIADITFYSSKRCPYCVDVQNYLDKESIKVKTVYIDGNIEARNQLKDKGGKTQVPCLVIDEYALYGSKEIVLWIKTHPERIQNGVLN